MDSDGIKWVLFDFGDVFCRPQNATRIGEMATLSGFSEDEFSGNYFHKRHDYDQGLIDGRAYWKRMLDRAGRTLDVGTIDRLVALDVESWIEADERMVNFALTLQEKGMRIGVLSNMPPDHAVVFQERLDWLKRFDRLFLSAEIKLIKPMSEIYEYVLTQVDCEPGEILFIDDKEENLIAAEAVGIKGYHYTSERHVEDLEMYFGLGTDSGATCI